MKAYILAIAGVILLSAVITMIAPGGEMGKFLKGATKLAILVVLISPVINFVKSGEFEFAASSPMTLDGGYLKECSARLEEADEEEIRSFIMEKFNVESEVEVTRSDDAPFSREKIAVVVAMDGINGEDGHIHIVTCIQEEVEARYGVQTEVS